MSLFSLAVIRADTSLEQLLSLHVSIGHAKIVRPIAGARHCLQYSRHPGTFLCSGVSLVKGCNVSDEFIVYFKLGRFTEM